MLNAISVLLLAGLLVIGASQPKDPDIMQLYEMTKSIRSLSEEFSEYFKNVTLQSLGVLDFEVATQEDQFCLEDMAELMKGLSSRQLWAFKSKSSQIIFNVK